MNDEQRAALEQVRRTLKGMRGLALDAGEPRLDREAERAIDQVDRLLATDPDARCWFCGHRPSDDPTAP